TFAADGTLYAFHLLALRRWDLATGKPRPVPSGRFEHLAVSPDAKTLAGVRSRGPGVELWDVATVKQLNLTPGHNHPPHALAFSRDGKTLVSAGDHVRLWDAAAARTTRIVDREVAGLFRCADGRVLFATAGPDGRTVDLATGEAVVPGSGQPGPVTRQALSADGRVMATAHAVKDGAQPGQV